MAKKKVAKKKVKRAAKKTKKVKKASKRKANPAFMKALTPDATLAAIVGSKPLPRTQVVKKLWAYVKKNKLQGGKGETCKAGAKVYKGGQVIMCGKDAKMKALCGGKPKVAMTQMTKYAYDHLK